MPEPRSRGASNSNSRGTRGGSDRAGRSSSIQSGSSGTGKIFSPKVCIHELLNLVTKFLVFHFQHNQIIWLQDHRYWGLLWQHPIQLRSKQFQGNKYSGTGGFR